MGFLITVSASLEMVINDSVWGTALLGPAITAGIMSKQPRAYPRCTLEAGAFNPLVMKLGASC